MFALSATVAEDLRVASHRSIISIPGEIDLNQKQAQYKHADQCKPRKQEKVVSERLNVCSLNHFKPWVFVN